VGNLDILCATNQSCLAKHYFLPINKYDLVSEAELVGRYGEM